MERLLNIAYCEVESDIRQLDLFVPDRPNGAGILFIHGGGWTGGSRGQWHANAAHFANLGYLCASASYHLAPDSKFPKQVDDVRLAMQWFKNHAAELGCEPDHIATWGSSAGAHLAALLGTLKSESDIGATQELRRRNTRPAAMVLYCAVLDCSPNVQGEPIKPSRIAFFGEEGVTDPAVYGPASPITHVDALTPPTLMVTGRHDRTTPLEVHEAFRDKLQALGQRADLVVLPDAGHGFGYGVTSENQRVAILEAEHFLESVLLKS